MHRSIAVLFWFLALSNAASHTTFEFDCVNKTLDMGKKGFFDRGSCVVEQATPAIFGDARPACKDFGVKRWGHLVHIIDKERRDMIKREFAMAAGDKYHIGLMQDNEAAPTDQDWYWINRFGSVPEWPAQMSSKLWKLLNATGARGPDDGDNTEACGILHYESDQTGAYIEDAPCGDSLPYICEYFDGTTINYRQTAFDMRGTGDSIFDTQTKQNQLECAMACANYEVCHSFSFGFGDQQCKLMYNTDLTESASEYKLYAKIH